MEEATTAAATVGALAAAGIDRVFGLPGGEILVLMEEFRRAGIDFVLMRHEADAGLAAAVYGKLRRQPGVVVTTLGPGAANLMFPLSSSYLDREPLLAISAQIPEDLPANCTHQRLPLDRIFEPICKVVGRITPGTIHEVVPRALAATMEEPLGAAFLSLSAREARESVEPVPGPRAGGGPSSPERPASRPEAAADAARAVTEAVAAASRPLLLVGLGTAPSNADRLRRWVSAWSLPVVVTPKVKGIMDETEEGFLGTVGGMAADGLMCDLLAHADLLIGFGFDPVENDKNWHNELPLLWVLETPNVGGILPDGCIIADHAALLEELVQRAPPREWGRPFSEFRHRREELLEGNSVTPDTMWPGDLIRGLASAVPTETVVTTDVGAHKYLFGQFWPARYPETFWMSNGLSGMGYGLGAAIGAKLARPSLPVLAVVGDGGFSMNFQELETARRIGAPFVTVVLQDRSYALIKLAQEARKLPAYRMDFSPIDSILVAEACGIRGLRTADPEQMSLAVREAIASEEPLVVEVPINYEDYRRLI